MKTYIKIALFVVFFLALAGIGFGLYLFNLQHKDLMKVSPDFVLTAADLQKAFENNEADAGAKYVNRIIEVTGSVGSVKRGEDNIISITLETRSDISSVICTFAAESDTSKLVPGMQVTIRGECSGFLMDVLLNNCVLIK